MSKGHECDTELDSPLQFRFRRINEIGVVFFFLQKSVTQKRQERHSASISQH